MSVLISMAAFALAASISPGPVNVVALSSGMQFGLGPSLRHVLGATVGFVVLLLFTGFGLHEVLKQWPILTDLIRWAGMAFLLYLAWKLVWITAASSLAATPGSHRFLPAPPCNGSTPKPGWRRLQVWARLFRGAKPR